MRRGGGARRECSGNVAVCLMTLLRSANFVDAESNKVVALLVNSVLFGVPSPFTGGHVLMVVVRSAVFSIVLDIISVDLLWIKYLMKYCLSNIVWIDGAADAADAAGVVQLPPGAAI